MIMLSRVVSTALLTIAIGAATLPFPARATPDAPVNHAFIDLLSHIPATAADLDHNVLNYVDLWEINAARPGAAVLHSQQDYDALSQTRTASGALAMAAFTGARMGDWASNLLDMHRIGIDPFAVQRSLTYGAPPHTMLLLNGGFDGGALDKAFTGRGFTQADLTNTAKGTTLWCGSQGCAQGDLMDLNALDQANPFGGSLGRHEPIALVQPTLQAAATPGYLFGSSDYALVRAQVDAAQGNGLTLLNVPDYSALAESIAAQGIVVQAQFIDPVVVSGSNNLPAILSGITPTPGTLTAPLPPYTRAVFAHAVKGDVQLTLVALAYDRAADAQTAVQMLPARIAVYRSYRYNQPFATLYGDRGAKLDAPTVYTGKSGKSVALLIFRSPLESSTPNASGVYQQSGALYALFINMLNSRDLDWLAFGSAS